jgi:thymidine kinase
MPHLDIIMGPMFAGKSTELIRRIRQLKVIKKKFIVVKPSIDNRYSENHVVSHNNDKEYCIVFENLNNFIQNTELNNIDTIFIDEAQFFPDLKSSVEYLVEKLKKNVVIVGLDGDFNRNKFGQIFDLIPFSDTCVKINSLCEFCGDMTPAIFSLKLNNNNNQVEIGSDIYKAVCRKHYNMYNKNNSE